MADIFEDRVELAINSLKKIHGDRVKVTPESKFVGFDGAQKVINSDIDVVLLVTPPYFRPKQWLHILKSIVTKHILARFI